MRSNNNNYAILVLILLIIHNGCPAALFRSACLNFIGKTNSVFLKVVTHTVQGKSWDHCCACAAGASSDLFPSMIAHCGAMVRVAQPQVCYINSPQDAIDKKSSMCRRVSEAAKTHLGVDIAGSSLFDAIGHLRPPAPSAPKPKTPLTKSEAPFKFTSSTKVTKPSAILKTLSPANKPSRLSPNSLKLHSRSIILGHLS